MVTDTYINNFKGFGAVKCVWIEAKSENKKESTESLLKHVGRIVLIWIAIYFAIALPFWCQKGRKHYQF